MQEPALLLLRAAASAAAAAAGSRCGYREEQAAEGEAAHGEGAPRISAPAQHARGSLATGVDQCGQPSVVVLRIRIDPGRWGHSLPLRMHGQVAAALPLQQQPLEKKRAPSAPPVRAVKPTGCFWWRA